MDLSHMFAANQAPVKDQNNAAFNNTKRACIADWSQTITEPFHLLQSKIGTWTHWVGGKITRISFARLKNNCASKHHQTPQNRFLAKLEISSVRNRLDLVQILLARYYMFHRIMNGLGKQIILMTINDQ